MNSARIDDRPRALAAWEAFWPRINDIWLTHMLIVPPVYSLLEELAQLYASLTGRPATDVATFWQGRAETLQVDHSSAGDRPHNKVATTGSEQGLDFARDAIGRGVGDVGAHQSSKPTVNSRA
jgi:hypothetical protein